MKERAAEAVEVRDRSEQCLIVQCFKWIGTIQLAMTCMTQGPPVDSYSYPLLEYALRGPYDGSFLVTK